MGAWHPVKWHSIFPFYHDATDDALYVLGNNGIFTRHRSNLMVQPTYAHEEQPARLFANMISADVVDFRQFELHNIPYGRFAPAAARPQTFVDYLSSLPYHKQRMMGRI